MLQRMQIAIVCIAVFVMLIATTAHAALPVSPGCRSAHVQQGVWFAVRRPMQPIHMKSLRGFYRKTVRRRGNIFGTDFCTFEAHLVSANPIGANGRPINDRMTNLKAMLYMPVKPRYATAWMCVHRAGTHCPQHAGYEKIATTPSGIALWSKTRSQSQTSTHATAAHVPAAISRRLERIEHGLHRNTKTLSAMADMQIGTQEDLAALSRVVKSRQQTFQQQLERIDTKLGKLQLIQKEVRDLAQQSNRGTWKDIALAALSLAGLLSLVGAIGVFFWRRHREEEQDVPTSTELDFVMLGNGFVLGVPKNAVHLVPQEQHEPGDMIPIQVPAGEPGEGLLVTREVMLKTKARGAGFEYWVMPEHLDHEFYGMNAQQRLEKVMGDPRRYLVKSTSLTKHWSGCATCRHIHQEHAAHA